MEQRTSPDPGDEIVEHIARDGSVIELVTRRRMRAENLLHRSVAIIVTSSDGRLLVHQRAHHKDVYPGWWDVAAGGVVGVGEDDELAAHRELREELGIDGDLRFVTAATFEDAHARERCHVFAVVHDGPYRFDDGEIEAALLVTPRELDALRQQHRFLPGGLAMVLPHVTGFTDPVRCWPMQRVEFTVEPFVEGQPGRHVTAPVDAVRELGIDVEFGPFGSECVADADRTPDVVAAIVRAAIEHAATHITIDITALDG